MGGVTVMTRSDLRRALVAKGVLLKDYGNAREMADTITAYGLNLAICGKHDGKPVTFERAFELIYGERLGGVVGRRKA
jgi:hypothetical protein